MIHQSFILTNLIQARAKRVLVSAQGLFAAACAHLHQLPPERFEREPGEIFFFVFFLLKYIWFILDLNDYFMLLFIFDLSITFIGWSRHQKYAKLILSFFF